jgi:hypothetical protein
MSKPSFGVSSLDENRLSTKLMVMEKAVDLTAHTHTDLDHHAPHHRHAAASVGRFSALHT